MSADSVLPLPAATVPRRSRRTWLWWLVGTCLALPLVACAGFTSLAVLGGFTYRHSVSDDPKVIEARRALLGRIDIPPEFKPALSFDLYTPFVHRRVATWVVYQVPETDSFIALADFGGPYSPEPANEVCKSLELKIVQQGKAFQRVDVKETHPQKFTIRGAPAEFIFHEGTGSLSNEDYWQVCGKFKTLRASDSDEPEGTGILLIRVPVDQYSKDHLIEIIQSIR